MWRGEMFDKREKTNVRVNIVVVLSTIVYSQQGRRQGRRALWARVLPVDPQCPAPCREKTGKSIV